MKLVLLFLLSLPLTTFSAERSITVSAENWVAPGKILFGDIAKGKGLTEKQWADLKAITLGDAPLYGESRRFSNGVLAEILRGKVAKLSGVNLVIPREIVVHGEGVRITDEDVKARIMESVKKICADCTYEVSDLRPPIFTNFPPATRWELKADWDQTRGSFSIPLEIHEPGAAKKIHWISGNLRIQREVPVATRLLAIGTKISKSDFKLIKRDITYGSDTSAEPSEFETAEVKTGIPAGQVIWRSSLSREKALSFGEVVTVISGTEDFKVTLKAVSRQNGFIGDNVQVQNPETKKIIVGKIIAKGVVEVK